TVTLSNPSSQTITVEYATADGTATAGSDYTAIATTMLTFAPGETSKTISVAVLGDVITENNETFFVNLSNASSGATILDDQGIGTILDNDGINISISDASATEGNTGTTPMTFHVTLSKASTQTVTVDYKTVDGTALSGSDYVALSTATLSFSPGQTSKDITVMVNGDTFFEGNEVFTVNLSNPTNATILKEIGVGTIIDDDGTPTISINSTVTVTEGNTGTTPATFTVTLSNPSQSVVTVDYSTMDVTAVGGLDYVTASGRLTFAPGATTQTFNVLVKGDLIVEGDETFKVTLSNPSN